VQALSRGIQDAFGPLRRFLHRVDDVLHGLLAVGEEHQAVLAREQRIRNAGEARRETR
jgi:hypothetical protein